MSMQKNSPELNGLILLLDLVKARMLSAGCVSLLAPYDEVRAAHAEVIRGYVSAPQARFCFVLVTFTSTVEGVGDNSRIAFIPFCTLCSRTNVSPEWIMSIMALARMASRSFRKTLA
jgi:hypothetical protein